jgi:hypothetical protein
MTKSSKAEARIVPVFRKSNLTDSEFIQEILARIMVASNNYVSTLDNHILETKTEECQDEEEGDIVKVRYITRSEICTDDGVCNVSAEIILM